MSSSLFQFPDITILYGSGFVQTYPQNNTLKLYCNDTTVSCVSCDHVAMPTMIFTMQHPLCNIAMLLTVLILFMQSLNPTPN